LIKECASRVLQEFCLNGSNGYFPKIKNVYILECRFLNTINNQNVRKLINILDEISKAHSNLKVKRNESFICQKSKEEREMVK